VTAPPEAATRRALLVVRNAFEHDARVLRAAQTLTDLGYEATVLAARGERDLPRAESRDGVRVIRVGPSSGALRRAYLRLRTGAAGGAATAAGERSEPAAGAGDGARAATLGRLVRWAATLDFYARGIAVALRVRPAIVQCNDYNTMWIGVAARLLAGSALVYDSHELWADRNLRPEARWWLLACEGLFVRVAHRVVMTSPAHAEVLAGRYRVAAPVVVRNIPEQRITVSRQGNGAGPSDGAPVAVYVGGVLRNRGIEQSIRALPAVEGLRLRLLGPVAPTYRAELERLAGALGVEDRVEFSPPVPPAEVVDALSSASVGLALFEPVCLSHRLVLPNKLFEYVLAGLPVVGSDLPMISRFVRDHDVGAAVDPGNPAAIAAALREVLEPARRQQLRAAVARAQAGLDWKRERETLADVYRDALAAARS
jgi:glycosyltransferase involved in cell wall biosynthesis